MYTATPYLYYMSYLGSALGFCFMTLSLAAGLYYLAEFVEEYSTLSKKIIRYTLWTLVVLHIPLLVVDRFPWWRVGFGILCHLFYSLLLKTFPMISLTSPEFIGSCVLAVGDHFLWFNYFSSRYASFWEISTFFGIFVWLVPFMFFVSLSAADNVLPLQDPSLNRTSSSFSLNGAPGEDGGLRINVRRGGKRRNLLKGFMDFFISRRDAVLPQSARDAGLGKTI
ncbi:TEX261 protein [Hyaloraphidium curvatum]|nr:TEX261 protein [Hyaloraphidium curvatum]